MLPSRPPTHPFIASFGRSSSHPHHLIVGRPSHHRKRSKDGYKPTHFAFVRPPLQSLVTYVMSHICRAAHLPVHCAPACSLRARPCTVRSSCSPSTRPCTVRSSVHRAPAHASCACPCLLQLARPPACAPASPHLLSVVRPKIAAPNHPYLPNRARLPEDLTLGIPITGLESRCMSMESVISTLNILVASLESLLKPVNFGVRENLFTR